MRRAARGRVFPQSYSTDRRYGRLSLKACALFPLLWANADDQGRLSGDAEEIKYAVCPNIDHITKADIPDLLAEYGKNDLIKVYDAPKSTAIQVLDWWDVQRLQWAWPSDYPPPDGWKDRLRYKHGREQVVTSNWGDPPESSPETLTERQQKLVSPEVSPENKNSPLEKEKEKEKERGKGKGNSPESSGENPLPSPASLSPLYLEFTSCYEKGWGLKPSGKIIAQMRDFAEELSAAGCPVAYVSDAFREAARYNKYSLSYVRKMLLQWLGQERGPP